MIRSMEQFNTEIRPVQPRLAALLDKFPSRSEMALIHDAEEKLRIADHMWTTGQENLATCLILDACEMLYTLADAISR